MKKPRMDAIEYDDPERGIHIRVTAGEKGIATIWDKDILIYVISLLNDRLERGLPVSRTVSFAAYDLLTVLNRHTGKTDYERLYDGLFRLRSTNIETSIEADGMAERRGFGWIETWKVEERTLSNGKKAMSAIQITLNDWMFRAIVNERRILAIDKRYFDISMGIERRLYELARKHCGNQPEWVISLRKLSEKCGVTRELRKFKADVKDIIDRDETPEYRFEFLPAHVVTGAGDATKIAKVKNDRQLIRVTPRGDHPVCISLDQARYIADKTSVHRGRRRSG
jgi:plasmid replication initiation protein